MVSYDTGYLIAKTKTGRIVERTKLKSDSTDYQVSIIDIDGSGRKFAIEWVDKCLYYYRGYNSRLALYTVYPYALKDSIKYGMNIDGKDYYLFQQNGCFGGFDIILNKNIRFKPILIEPFFIEKGIKVINSKMKFVLNSNDFKAAPIIFK